MVAWERVLTPGTETTAWRLRAPVETSFGQKQALGFGAMPAAPGELR